MKPWQHGYELDYLKNLSSKYSDYNSFALSPFAEVKKNNIAEMLHKGTLKIFDDSFLEIAPVKVNTPIFLHGKTLIATKQKGDVTISKLSGNINNLAKHINSVKENSWLYVWAEDSKHNDLAKDCGFTRVGSKITTFGEIHAIYYRGENREFSKVNPAEILSIKKIDNVDQLLIGQIKNKLDLLPSFTNHYSNYNKGKSWSALSLRGYSSDPSFITKPSEMNDKWLEEHRDIEFSMQDTPLYDNFFEVRSLLSRFNDTEIHRVRFMKLAPNNGELTRHTDQVDDDSGGSLGKLARLHFPIKTNDKVLFTVWDCDGREQCVNMKEGECWFLDTRKPHRAINAGNEERIHLVVDVLVNERIQEVLCKA
jgi:hypothetical protein